MIPLIEIFCFIDDFCKQFEQLMLSKGLEDGSRKRQRSFSMSLSEVMTILVMFHLSHYRNFKDFYFSCLLREYRWAFPKAVSYNRFVELEVMAFMPLIVLVMGFPGRETGRYFVDSTKLAVCHNLRINRHKVFKDVAQRGKTSTGWFYGFKLHLVLNDQGELMSFGLTPGNVDDRRPLTKLMKGLQGWLFGDKGYLGHEIATDLKKQGIELITRMRKNMKQAVPLCKFKGFLLSKRGMIETAIDQLKNLLHIDHTRHRSVMNFQVNVLAGLLAYLFKPKKVAVPFNRLNGLNPLKHTILTPN
jgi:hypothetical protein